MEKWNSQQQLEEDSFCHCMVSPPAGLEDDLAIVRHRDTIIVGQCQNLVVVQHGVQIPQIMRQSDKIYTKGSFCCDLCRESQSQDFNFRIIEGEANVHITCIYIYILNVTMQSLYQTRMKVLFSLTPTTSTLKPRSSIQMASTGPSQTIQVVYFKAPWKKLNRWLSYGPFNVQNKHLQQWILARPHTPNHTSAAFCCNCKSLFGARLA